MAHSYSWIAGSGAWNAAGDWADLTAGTSPASTFPGAADTAAITGPNSEVSDLITGPGAAAVLNLLNLVAVGGTLTAGSATAGATDDGGVEVLPGATLSAGSLVATSVSLSVDGAGGLLAVGGLLTNAGFGEVTAVNGGVVTAGTLTMSSGSLGTDPTGRIEIGGAGTGAAGAITVDAGAVASVLANLYGPVVVNGVINGTDALFHGPVTGSGSIAVQTNSFAGAVGAGLHVSLGSIGEMTLQAPASFAATVAGFAAGQLIAVQLPGLNQLSYAGNASGGTLSLQQNGTTLAGLSLAGNYLSSSFLLLPFNGAYFQDQIAVATNAATAPAAAPAGPGNADAYSWNLTTGGAWSAPGNWTDSTAGTAAASSPGSLNPVTISSAVYGYQVVNGNGNAAALSTRGDTALNGSFHVASLTVPLTFTNQPSTLVVMPGGTLAVAGSVDLSGSLDADNSTVTVAGALTLDYAYGSAVQAYAGGLVQLGGLAGLALGNVSVDGSGRVEFGSAGGAAAGAITVDAGVTVPLAQMLGNVIDNGTLTVAAPVNYGSGAITGNLNGTGLMALAAGATTNVSGTIGTGITIAFGATSSLGLSLSGGMGALLTNFTVGDTIATGSEIVAAGYTAGTGTLVLTGTSAATLGTIAVAGSYAGMSFLALNSAPGYGNLVEGAVVVAAGTLQVGATPAPSAGTTSGDAYSFTGNGGAWNAAANWSDTTKGQTPAAVAPGSLDTVSIPDSTTTQGRWEVISGSGRAASLAVGGNVALSGSFDLGAVTVNASATSTYQTIGALEVVAGATATASSVQVSNLLAASGPGARLGVSGTIGLGSVSISGTLNATGGALVQAAGLSGNGGLSYLANSVLVDSASTIEIGTAGGALTGALNIDAGVTVPVLNFTMNGALNNRGTLAVAANGDATFNGDITGAGSIVLGSNVYATFGSTNGGQVVYGSGGMVASSQTIVLGANDTLTFGSFSTPVIENFTAGDVLTFDADITGAVWNAGTLALSTDGTPVGSLAMPGIYAGARFITAQAPGGTGISSSRIELVACFAEGTRIATENGPVAVEDLRPGDRVRSAFGGSVPVRWLGHRRIDCARHPRPHDVRPVRIAADAFGPSQPARTLWLSPDHAVHVDGVLVPARYLVNGASIVQEDARPVTYWHVELPQHDVLLAEGLECESYLDTGNRGAFVEAAAPLLHADFAAASRDVWAAEGCAVLVTEGPRLAAIRARLLGRAIAAGHRLSADAGLVVEADGRALATVVEGDRVRCQVPEGTRAVRLLSNSWVPAELGRGVDGRRLGVAIATVELDGRAVSLDAGCFGAGWHQVEADRRWTDGAGELTLGCGALVLTVVRDGAYWQAARAKKASGHRAP